MRLEVNSEHSQCDGQGEVATTYIPSRVESLTDMSLRGECMSESVLKVFEEKKELLGGISRYIPL